MLETEYRESIIGVSPTCKKNFKFYGNASDRTSWSLSLSVYIYTLLIMCVQYKYENKL